MEELSLVKRCLSGEEFACKQLFDLYSSPMLGLCMRYSDNHFEAEDNLQEAFIKIFQNLHTWKSTGPLGAWIRRIMINTCLTKQKTAYNLHTVSGLDEFHERAVDPDILSQLGYEEIQTLISTMPIGYRTAFTMNIVEGFSYEEMSELLHVTESTCRSQVFKAKNYLAKRIELLHPKLKHML
ncbi:MAG: RNA polymerase sigma factor [Saprospiraceae bacterium]